MQKWVEKNAPRASCTTGARLFDSTAGLRHRILAAAPSCCSLLNNGWRLSLCCTCSVQLSGGGGLLFYPPPGTARAVDACADFCEFAFFQ